MAKNILDQPVGVNRISLVDGAFITLAKLGVKETFSLVPFVRNGTFTSSAVKLGGALLLGQSRNKQVSYIATGMLIDGVEDGVNAVKGMLWGNKTANNNNSVSIVM